MELSALLSLSSVANTVMRFAEVSSQTTEDINMHEGKNQRQNAPVVLALYQWFELALTCVYLYSGPCY